MAAADFITALFIVLTFAGGAFALWAVGQDAREGLYFWVVVLAFVGATGWAASFCLPNNLPHRWLAVAVAAIGLPFGLLMFFVGEAIRMDHEHTQKLGLEIQRAEEGYPTACLSYAEHLLRKAEEMSDLLEERYERPPNVWPRWRARRWNAYLRSRGLPVDEARAARENRQRVNSLRVEAYKWFLITLACAERRPFFRSQVTEKRIALERTMLPEQIADAEKRASDWLVEFSRRARSTA